MYKNIIITVVLSVLLVSCSETKYVAEGEYLLDRLTVKSDAKSKLIVPSEMRMLVRHRPLLEGEGVHFKSNGHVDMSRHLWEPEMEL